jgi:membrane associated rhomboid family serine protease
MIPLGDENPSKSLPLVMWILILLNVLVFLSEFAHGSNGYEQMITAFGLTPYSIIREGYYLTFFTSMFLHANLLHLGGNVFFLLLFGTALEEQVSVKRWMITYFASGLAGNILFLLLLPDASGVGASGAIWGLLAAAGGFRGLIGMIFLGGLDIFAGGGFLAHAGGLLAGLALRFSWLRRIR